MEMLSASPGHIKIRLSFLTSSPRHIHSHILAEEYGCGPPFVEDVCVLVPSANAFTILEAYMPAFSRLHAAGAVPGDSSLYGFRVLDEDVCTLAHLVL